MATPQKRNNGNGNDNQKDFERIKQPQRLLESVLYTLSGKVLEACPELKEQFAPFVKTVEQLRDSEAKKRDHARDMVRTLLNESYRSCCKRRVDSLEELFEQLGRFLPAVEKQFGLEPEIIDDVINIVLVRLNQKEDPNPDPRAKAFFSIREMVRGRHNMIQFKRDGDSVELETLEEASCRFIRLLGKSDSVLLNGSGRVALLSGLLSPFGELGLVPEDKLVELITEIA